MKRPYQIHIGPVPAVAISPTSVFGSHHVAKDFTTARITTADGVPYYGASAPYVRTTRHDGVVVEEAGCDYNFRERNEYGAGGEVCATLRPMPEECVTRSFFKPEIGKTINVESPKSGLSIAHVVAFGPGWIETDWAPQYGDSGALCWGEDGSFVGAVKSGIRGDGASFIGSFISTPPQVSDPMLEGTIAYAPGTWPGSTPAPATAPAPTPAPAPEPTLIPNPVALPRSAIASPEILPMPALSSGAIAQTAPSKWVTAFPPTFMVAGSSVFAIRSDGALFRLSSLTNLWEQMPDIPNK